MEPDEPWFPEAPAPVVPVPAANVPDLRGRRVIIGASGVGWRYDLRADNPVVQNGRTHVPVLLEHEYYRAELTEVEVFAPLIPIEQVWVEHRLARHRGRPRAAPELIEDELVRLARAGSPDTGLLDRLVQLDNPPPRPPRPAREVVDLTGRRVVMVSPTGEERNLRAASEPFQSADGDICVRICAEADWYRWALAGESPSPSDVPIYLLWVE